MILKKAVVNLPVADLRREPVHGSGRYFLDLVQESQLLFGEKVVVIKEKSDGWSRIEAIEQKKF